MIISAMRGDQTFLVTEKEVEPDTNPVARIVSLARQVSYIIPFQQALKWGYWEEPEGITPEVQQVVDEIYPKVVYDYTKDAPTELARKLAEAAQVAKSSYNVYKDTKVVGVVSFGSAPAIEITTQDPKLLGVITHAMVNPVSVTDDEGGTIYATIGDILFEDAVLQLIKNAGFETKRR